MSSTVSRQVWWSHSNTALNYKSKKITLLAFYIFIGAWSLISAITLFESFLLELPKTFLFRGQLWSHSLFLAYYNITKNSKKLSVPNKQWNWNWEQICRSGKFKNARCCKTDIALLPKNFLTLSEIVERYEILLYLFYHWPQTLWKTIWSSLDTTAKRFSALVAL